MAISSITYNFSSYSSAFPPSEEFFPDSKVALKSELLSQRAPVDKNQNHPSIQKPPSLDGTADPLVPLEMFKSENVVIVSGRIRPGKLEWG